MIETNKSAEWLYDAGVHIFIAAKSDSPNFNEDTIKALKDARAAQVEIHVALYQPKGTELPPVWKEIKSLAATFNADVPYAKFVRCREMVVADDNVYTETKDSTGNWVGCSEEKSPTFATALGTFFNVDTKALEHDIADYKRLLEKDLERFERGTEARMYMMMPGLFPQPGRFSYRLNKQLEEDVQKRLKSEREFEKSLLGRAVNVITMPFKAILGLCAFAWLMDEHRKIQIRRKNAGLPTHDLGKYPIGRGARSS